MVENRLRLLPDPSKDLSDSRGDNPHFKLLIEGWGEIPNRRIDLALESRESSYLTLILWPDFILEKLTTSLVMRMFGCFESNFIKRLSILYLGRSVQRACKRIMNIKGLVFWQIHEISGHHIPDSYLLFDQKIRQTIIDKSSAIFITEKSTYDEISRHFKLSDKECVVSHLGGYREFYGNRLNSDLARGRLKIPLEKTTVLLFGRARKDKNFDSIINALIDKGFYLIFAGQGYEVLNIDKSKYLEIAGFVPRSEVATLFSAADYVIKPETNYLNSGVIRLAISYELPVIAYNYGSTKDLARGCLIDLSNPRWSETIPDRNSSKYRSMVVAAQNRDVSRNWIDAAQNIHDKIVEVLDAEKDKIHKR